MKSRLFGIVSVATLSLSIFGAITTPALAGPAADESLLLTLTNAARAAAGVPGLTLDANLSSVARQWAASMAAAGGISHNANLKNQIDSDWAKVGENVGFGGTVEAIHTALLNSPAHYRNIVDPEFERIGIGVVVVNGTVWLVEDFLAPAAPVATPPPAPAPEPVPAAAVPSTSAPAPPPTTTAPPATTTTTTTTTLPPATTSTVAPQATPGMPLQLALMVQQVRSLAVSQ